MSNSALLDPILGLRVSWLVVRNDTGATVLNEDTALTSSALTIEIDRWSGDLKYNVSWTVTCEVYHPTDPITPKHTYFDKSLSVDIAMAGFGLSSPPHRLTDLTPIPVYWSILDSRVLEPSVGLVQGLSVSWKAVRQDTGATVLSEVEPLSDSVLVVNIDRSSGTLIYNDTWSVTCQLYHPADAEVPRSTYFNQTLSVGVTDVVDRHHPYVRWDHTAFFHDPNPPSMPMKSRRLWDRSRHSRVHRTDVLIRCEVLNQAVSALLRQQAALEAGVAASPGTRPTMSYLDTLTIYGGSTRSLRGDTVSSAIIASLAVRRRRSGRLLRHPRHRGCSVVCD